MAEMLDILADEYVIKVLALIPPPNKKGGIIEARILNRIYSFVKDIIDYNYRLNFNHPISELIWWAIPHPPMILTLIPISPINLQLKQKRQKQRDRQRNRQFSKVMI